MSPKKKKSSEMDEQLQQDKHLIAKIQSQGGIAKAFPSLSQTRNMKPPRRSRKQTAK